MNINEINPKPLILLTNVQETTVNTAVNNEKKYVAKSIINMLDKPTCCIVYNHFSLDAMMAAAVYKTQTPGSVVYSSIKQIPSDIDFYIVIGMRKVQSFYNPLKRIFNFNNAKLDYSENIKCYWVETKGHDYMSTPSLFHKVCEEFGVVSEVIDQISYAVGRIYEKDLTLSQLVLVYVNMMLAQAAIVDTRRNYKPRDILNDDNTIRGTDIENFRAYVKAIQHKVNGSINLKYFTIGNKTYKTILTNITDDYFWSMRLIRIAHEYVVNLAITPRGYLIDSNISDEDCKSIEVQIDFIKAETF
jgi:hypothetical protein